MSIVQGVGCVHSACRDQERFTILISNSGGRDCRLQIARFEAMPFFGILKTFIAQQGSGGVYSTIPIRPLDDSCPI